MKNSTTKALAFATVVLFTCQSLLAQEAEQKRGKPDPAAQKTGPEEKNSETKKPKPVKPEKKTEDETPAGKKPAELKKQEKPKVDKKEAPAQDKKAGSKKSDMGKSPMNPKTEKDSKEAKETPTKKDDSKDEAATTKKPVKKTGNWYIRQSPAMLKAIQPIVETAKGATVKVLGNVKVRSKETQAQIALGTVVDMEGFILTKASELISRGTSLQVEIDGKKVPAKIHGIYESSDIAMLKIEPAGLQIKPIEWQTQPAQIGTFLATPNGAGKPLGFGVLSVATRGEPGLMGVQLQNVSEKEKGSRVTVVSPKSAAEEEGIAVGDIFTHVNGNEVKNTEDLIAQVRKLDSGDIVKVKIKRKEKLLEFAIKLKSRMTGARLNPQETIAGNKLSKRRTGFDKIIQHDTVLKPEQMGGPILDLDGRAIGINIAKNGRVATYALPISILGPAIEQLKSGKLNPAVVYKPKIDALVKTIEEKEKALEKSETRKKVAENEKQEEIAKEAEEKAAKRIRELQAELEDELLMRKMMEDKQKDLRAAGRKIKRSLRDAEKEIEKLKKEKKDIEDVFK